MFNSSYFEEHLQRAAFENMFMKLRNIKNWELGKIGKNKEVYLNIINN